MIEEIGVITAVDRDHIWVETEIKSTCGSCQAESSCGTGVVAKAFSPKKERLILRCRQTTKVGQKVKLGIEENSLLGASALMYLLPLAVLIGAALLSQTLLPLAGLNSELWTIALSFFCTWLCFRWLKNKVLNKEETKFQPKLLAILPSEDQLIPVKQSH